MSTNYKWYDSLLKEFPTTMRLYKRPHNQSPFVRDTSAKLEVLEIHGKLATYKNGGAYYQSNKMSDWVPVLPGYTIFTKIKNSYVKMCAGKDEEQTLCYNWVDYGCDSQFKMVHNRGRDYDMFTSLKGHLKIEREFSMPTMFGFTNVEIISVLQELVTSQFPRIFAEAQQHIKAAAKTDQAVRTVKRKNEAILAQLGTSEQAIQAGTLVNQHGVNLTAQESQALIVMNQELKTEKYNDQRTIKRLRNTVAQHNEPEELMETEETSLNVNSLVDSVLATTDIGSTIIVDTKKYISLVLSKPCISCFDPNPKNKTCYITCPQGLAVQCSVTCSQCNKSEKHSNEPDEVDLSRCAAAAIAGGVNHNGLTKVLAMMGITHQPSKKSYHTYQQTISQSVCKNAKECAEKALHDVLEYLQRINKNTLSVSFDVSWSHVRNANEASGEFIFQGHVPGRTNIYETLLTHMINQAFLP
jgi:hypothetical protein